MYISRYEQGVNGEYLITLSQNIETAKDFGSHEAAADIIQKARNPYDRKFVIKSSNKSTKTNSTKRDAKIS